MSQSTFDQAAAVIFQRCNFWSSLRWVSSRHPRWPRTTSSGPCSNTSPRPPPPPPPRSSTPPCSSSTSPPPPAPCSPRPPWFSSLFWYSCQSTSSSFWTPPVVYSVSVCFTMIQPCDGIIAHPKDPEMQWQAMAGCYLALHCRQILLCFLAVIFTANMTPVWQKCWR